MLTKSERTRKFIIEKTAPVFNSKGYAGTSLNDMMEITGLTKGSIYGNFENKDEVALAVFDYNFGLVVTYIRDKMESRTNTIEKLLVYPETYRNFFRLSFLREGCPLLNTATEADDTHPMLKEKTANALKFWKAAIEKRLKHGIDKKEIRADVNVSEFAVVLMSLIEGAIMQAKVTGKTTALNTTMNFLENMIKGLKN
jgi:AcrR family transcriptional regulator